MSYPGYLYISIILMHKSNNSVQKKIVEFLVIFMRSTYSFLDNPILSQEIFHKNFPWFSQRLCGTRANVLWSLEAVEDGKALSCNIIKFPKVFETIIKFMLKCCRRNVIVRVGHSSLQSSS